MDQTDDSASKLLETLRPAFKAIVQSSNPILPQKLLIIENLLPSGLADVAPTEAGLDILMLLLFNSKLRTEEDMVRLLQANKYEVVGVWKDVQGQNEMEPANGRGGKCLVEAVAKF